MQARAALARRWRDVSNTARQMELGEITEAKKPLAARVVFACLKLGTIADTDESCARCWWHHVRWEEDKLREYVDALEVELVRAGRVTLGRILPWLEE